MSYTAMADNQQKIPPIDHEASPAPSAPLFPHQPHQPSPPRRTIPVTYSPPPRKRSRSCCCRCICRTLFTTILLIAIIAATAATVDKLRVTSFTVASNLNAQASFDVTVTARNLNKHVGIYYEDDSHLSDWYSGNSLCNGSFPVFYQSQRNSTTVVTVTLSGQTQLRSDLETTLQICNRKTGQFG